MRTRYAFWPAIESGMAPRRLGPAAEGGGGDRRAATDQHEHRRAQDEQAGSWEPAEEVHVLTSFSWPSEGKVPGDLEKSLRAGRSSVKREPSIVSRPPCRTAVASTIARPRPEPGPPAAAARQKRCTAWATSATAIPAPSS